MKSEMKLYAVMGAIVALGGGFLVFNRDNGMVAPPGPTPPPVPLTAERFTDLEKGTRHFKGDPNARFTVIEFADFQCPSCRNTYAMVLKKFGKELPQVRFGFRHFPLDNVHPNALPAAIASEFAEDQGKFWDVYERLLANPQEQLSPEGIATAVKRAGLDLAQYEKSRTNPELRTRVIADREVGQQYNVEETPTFFVRDSKTGKAMMVVGWTNLYPVLKNDIAGLPTPLPKAGGGPPQAR